MTWRWDQSAGIMYDGTGAEVGRGYAGSEWGKNNPAAQAAKGIGPIPQGKWLITRVMPDKLSTTGPFSLVLEPAPGTDSLGRSAFRIHGDSIAHPGKASHGCIVLPRAVRELIWGSDDHDLLVVD